MKIKPKTITLKNGKEILIRQCEVNDAEHLRNTIKTYIKDSKYIPKLQEEFKLSISQGEDWIKSFIDRPNSLLLIAEFDNKIIGNIDLTGNPRKVMEHTAVIGMGMLAEWRNSGLGTELMKAAISWAKNNPILEILWLQVYTDNKLGVGLYQKMGFTENGIIKNFFKQDGIYFDNLTMSLEVK
ncbi:GNAT family N-acetyltransferase [Tenacibaculum amylolyticum]|uniref:GNAT family N-acetyltransferase n=1 Tax=Tenacibaculum amylolyticum TaxID=104269 RepID=UPI0038963027